MAKPSHPLMSLEAHGTVGDALTYQSNSKLKTVREKPRAVDQLTLPRAYHRWDYQDYAYTWTQLSAADKELWRPAGSIRGISPFNAFMRDKLLTLPDMAVRLRLDEQSGNVAHDSSKQDKDGVIIGTNLVEGVIDWSRHFDGLDDTISIAGVDSYLTSPFTIEMWFRCHTIASGESLYHDYLNPLNQLRIHFVGANDIKVFAQEGGVQFANFEADHNALVDDIWYHFIFLRSATRFRFWIDGVAYNWANVGGSLVNAWTPALHLASYNGVHTFQDCDIDNFILYTRELDEAEIIRHSERRYPLQ